MRRSAAYRRFHLSEGGRFSCAASSLARDHEESARLKRLRRDNAELRRAAILKTASAFFAAELDRPALITGFHRRWGHREGLMVLRWGVDRLHGEAELGGACHRLLTNQPGPSRRGCTMASSRNTSAASRHSQLRCLQLPAKCKKLA